MIADKNKSHQTYHRTDFDVHASTMTGHIPTHNTRKKREDRVPFPRGYHKPILHFRKAIGVIQAMIPTSSPLLGLRMATSGVAGPPTDFSEGCDHIDRVSAMLALSESTYSCSDYIGRRAVKETDPCHDQTSVPEFPIPIDHDKVDTVCREKMCEWSYRVCDHFQTGREIVAVSFSYLDRFVDKCSCDRSSFKLAAMTTLYMANKIYGGSPSLTICALTELSRREFEMSHISEMEVIILQTLEWRLHPPTIQCFVDSFYHCVSIPSKGSMSNAVYRRAVFFAELALYDYAFASKERSLVAISSLMNAMEGMENITIDQQNNFLDVINMTFDLKYTTDTVESTRNRLWYVYSMSAQYKEDDTIVEGATSSLANKDTPTKVGFPEHSSARSISPVSVANTNGPYHRQ